jgi:hypothetical protein
MAVTGKNQPETCEFVPHDSLQKIDIFHKNWRLTKPDNYIKSSA